MALPYSEKEILASSGHFDSNVFGFINAYWRIRKLSSIHIYLVLIFCPTMKAMKSNPVKTCLTIAMGFLIIYMLGRFEWALWTALFSGMSGIFSKPLAYQIEKFWMLLARVLSYIVPNMAMGFVFFCILLPVSLLSRLFRKQDTLKLLNTATTVYTESNKKYDKAHFENMW